MRVDQKRPLLAPTLVLVVAAACVGVLWLRFNAPPGSRGTVYPHDLLYSYYPKMAMVGARLAAGELPLWNPHGCAGVPLLASMQPAALYPPTWLAAFFEPTQVLASLVLFHFLLAAAGAALLFRAWGVGVWLAGVLAGVTVSSCLLGQSFWPPQVATFAWLPWILLCIERLVAGDAQWRWWLGLVFASALQLLAGFPQLVVYGLQLSVPYAIVRGAARAWRGEVAVRVAGWALVRVATAMVLGAGIAAAQLLPAAELIAESERAQAVGERAAHYLQREPRLGALLSNAVTPELRNPAVEIGDGAGYLGIGVLVLAAVALGMRAREPRTWVLGGVGLASLLLSDGYLGAARPVYELYASLPIVGQLRSPERLLLLAFFCVVALAALGAGACERALRGDRSGVRLGLAAAVAAAGLVAASGGAPAAWRAAIAAMLVAVALLAPPSRVASFLWPAVLAALLFADVVAVTGSHGSLRDLPRSWAHVMHVEGRRVVPAIEFAAERDRAGLGRIEVVGDGVRVRPIAGAGPIAGAYRLACYETPLPLAWQLAARMLRRGDYRSAVAANADPDRFATLYDAAGVVSLTEVVATDATIGSRLHPGGVYQRRSAPSPKTPAGLRVSRRENPDALPRAYLLSRHEQASHVENLLRLLHGDFDPRTSVLLEKEPGVASSAAIDSAIAVPIARYEPERVELRVEAPAPGLLVLSDTHYPGWRATIDDEAAEVLRANGLFRAIAVPAGGHDVVFEYAPASVRWGLWISTLCLLASLAVPLVGRRIDVRVADRNPQ